MVACIAVVSIFLNSALATPLFDPSEYDYASAPDFSSSDEFQNNDIHDEDNAYARYPVDEIIPGENIGDPPFVQLGPAIKIGPRGFVPILSPEEKKPFILKLLHELKSAVETPLFPRPIPAPIITPFVPPHPENNDIDDYFKFPQPFNERPSFFERFQNTLLLLMPRPQHGFNPFMDGE